MGGKMVRYAVANAPYARCEETYGRDPFPPGTLFKSDK